MSEEQPTSGQSGAATLRPQTIVINDKRELYKCYMPFIKGGGLFIPFNGDVTPDKIFPGQKIFIVFSMLEQKTKTPIHGKVVWINRGGMFKGFGVSIGETPAMKALKDNIENNIAELLSKKETTYTF